MGVIQRTSETPGALASNGSQMNLFFLPWLGIYCTEELQSVEPLVGTVNPVLIQLHADNQMNSGFLGLY